MISFRDRDKATMPGDYTDAEFFIKQRMIKDYPKRDGVYDYDKNDLYDQGIITRDESPIQPPDPVNLSKEYQAKINSGMCLKCGHRNDRYEQGEQICNDCRNVLLGRHSQ